MKREGKEGRRRGGEARSWEPYTHLLKCVGGGGQVPNRARQGWSAATCIRCPVYPNHFPDGQYRHTLTPIHLDGYTQNAHNIHIKRTHPSSHTTKTNYNTHADQRLNLALWLCAVTLSSLRPAECFTVALGPNTQTL